jgi:phosphopantothenoylcysteine synthetase/decarboxylase
MAFLDVAALAEQTGQPVLSAFRSPGQPRLSGTDDAVIVAPATFNSINKLAAGICDTYALAVVGEAIGAGVPVVILPAVNDALAARLPYRNAVASLRSEGVAILTDGDCADSFGLALRTLDAMVQRTPSPG